MVNIIAYCKEMLSKLFANFRFQDFTCINSTQVSLDTLARINNLQQLLKSNLIFDLITICKVLCLLRLALPN